MENGKRKTENGRNGNFRSLSHAVYFPLSIIRHSFSTFRFPFSIVFCFFLAACSSLEKPQSAPFYADDAPPPRSEFRWSDGGRLPKTFDPAFAAVAPETDVARALFEGLTDTDAQTLKIVPAIAVDWSSADDYKTWTFKLRGDARWSNGERVTAADFARSWKRLAALGTRVPHFNLLTNIVGIRTAKPDDSAVENQTELDLFSQKDLNRNLPPIFKSDSQTVQPKQESNARNAPQAADESNVAQTNKKDESKPKPTPKNEAAFGAVAVDDFTLKISLLRPDKDFPALVAHPIFRPIFGDGKSFESGKLNADIVTNGAFRVSSVNQTDGVTLARSESFWNKNKVQLERVRFVPTENAEKALEAYRAGDIDAITNHDFAPLALKLLTPFDDFRKTPHGALNFYEFNRARPPFDDRRVREALTISVERERLTQDEMDGASVPALSFLPFESEKISTVSQSAARARNLLAAAGFAGGENFPVVRLVVNRNNAQQRVARAVAKMWKQNLNVETEIVVKENADIETARQTGDFDVLRRGVVFPTTDEAANMAAIFGGENAYQKTPGEEIQAVKTPQENADSGNSNSQTNAAVSAENTNGANKNPATENPVQTPTEAAGANRKITTEADALEEFIAVPLYFPSAYSLVKPYIRGFDANALDAPSLQNVSIDNDWQPRMAKGES